MNNIKNEFKSIPVCDTHCHLIFPETIETTVEIFRNYMKCFELKSITLLALSRSGHRMFDPVNNLKALYCKAVLNSEKENSAYVYGTTIHFYDERDTAEGYLAQVSELYDMGVDGYKSLDGKPERRKALGKPLCDPIFDKMYSFIEEKGMPLKIHVGDPAMYWGDKAAIPPNALKRGWYYGDGTYPSLAELREEVEGILTKFPKLKLCIAHCGFFGDHLEKAIDFLERWENTSFDLVVGASQFSGFAKRLDEWQTFFEVYQDRLFFGTDAYNTLNTLQENARYEMIRKMLEWPSDRIVDLGPRWGMIPPLGLSDDVLKKLYNENQHKLLKDARPLNVELIIASSKKLVKQLEAKEIVLATLEERELESANLEKIIKYFSEN